MSKAKKTINGYHVTAMFVAFFGVIAAVNFLMASFALGSFSGTVVENSYVASQKYNEWLAESRKEAAHGWTVSEPKRVGDKLQILALNAQQQPLANAEISVLADHPVGRTEPFSLALKEKAPGQYVSEEILPSGRWKLKISVAEGDRSFDMVSEIK